MSGTIILATDLAGGLGYEGALPWPSSFGREDLKLFKELTQGKTLVMGSTTYFSMVEAGVKWGDRECLVLTTKDIPQAITSTDLLSLMLSGKELTFIGGTSLFNEIGIWDYCTMVYHTIYSDVYKADTYLSPEALDYLENNFIRTEGIQLNEHSRAYARTRPDRRFN